MVSVSRYLWVALLLLCLAVDAEGGPFRRRRSAPYEGPTTPPNVSVIVPDDDLPPRLTPGPVDELTVSDRLQLQREVQPVQVRVVQRPRPIRTLTPPEGGPPAPPPAEGSDVGEVPQTWLDLSLVMDLPDEDAVRPGCCGAHAENPIRGWRLIFRSKTVPKSSQRPFKDSYARGDEITGRTALYTREDFERALDAVNMLMTRHPEQMEMLKFTQESLRKLRPDN